jgi:SSS family solute:Na+ symporter
MIAGLIIVPIVSLITPKPDRAKIDEIFTCYDQTVTVPETENLGH